MLLYECACGDKTAELRCPTCGRATTLEVPTRTNMGLRPYGFRGDMVAALTARIAKRSSERREEA